MENLIVRPLQKRDIALIVGYFHSLSDSDCDRMGVDREQLPQPEDMENGLLTSLTDQVPPQNAFTLIWELNGKAIGMNTLKDMVPNQSGYMHLHMWAQDLRGKGFGRRFFCMAALDFYQRFALKQIYCEPRTTNPAPNRLLQSIGFPLIKTYIGQSSAIAKVCEINRYDIRQDDCRRFLGED